MIRNALCGLAAMVVFLAGCGATPAQRWDAATSAMQTAREVTMTLHVGGAITDDDVRTVHKIDLATRGALDVAYTQLPDGGDTFESYMAVAQQGLIDVAKVYGKPKEVK